jgi:Protein of unknown function (DUF3151)
VNERPVTLSTGLPETRLDPEPTPLLDSLAAALAIANVADRRDAVSKIVAANPTFLDGWARLSELGRDPVERYAAARVGYHRGLDRLRGSGWRGSGYVRWSHVPNQGFLRALDQLRASAEEIGETGEQDRCALFLLQLDPNWARFAPEAHL